MIAPLFTRTGALDGGIYLLKCVNVFLVPPTFNGGDGGTIGWISDGDVTTIVNSSLRLECEVEAVPPPAISWYRDGRILVFDPSKMILENVRY